MATQARLINDGASHAYTAGAAYSAGDVIVIGNSIGIAACDMANGEVGTVLREGVFEFTKAAGDGGISIDALVYWDDTNNVATATATGNTLIGPCVVAAPTEATKVQVKLTNRRA